MLDILNGISSIVWGVPGLVLILGTGIWLTYRTGFAQFRLFPVALKAFLHPSKRGDKKERSSYKALCTALAATIGTGNLAGVAGAIAIGGPGAVFWMWICGILGMIIKFAEATLAVCYQVKDAHEGFLGGPMYMITQGLPSGMHWLAGVYSFLGLAASFGVGNGTQINTVIVSIHSACSGFGLTWSKGMDLFAGAVLAVLIYVLFSGGGKRISTITEKLIPFAAGSYILLCIFVICARASSVPAAFNSIVHSAFSPQAITGGAVGSAFTALRVGACRGVFTNEAGMGTASIAHGTADVNHPIEQGFMGIIEVFIDTLVICTMTALVILCSGVSVPYGTDPGIELTNEAFTLVCGQWVGVFITISLCLFAVATVLGWGFYGGRCAQYLFGKSSWKWYVIGQSVMTFAAVLFRSNYIWSFSEILNGLMSIPNLLALILLCPVLVKVLREYRIEKASKS